MFSFFLILRPDPALLRLICAMGFASGVTAFILGFRRPRTLPQPTPSPESTLPIPARNSSRQSDSAEPEIVTPQVIRLSLSSIPARSSDMTQQQKVAAALSRAGIASPAGWTDSSADRRDTKSASTSTAVAEFPPPASQGFSSASQAQEKPGLTWGRILLLFGGLLLALVSLYLFLRIR